MVLEHPARNDIRLTVITPCLNGARYVAKAVASVVTQGYPWVEHIVADGGSSDGTLQILSRYPHLKVLTSPDRGMYDALNKALAVAGGDVIGFLNCDDCYADGAFGTLIEAFGDAAVMAVAGEAVSFGETADGGHLEVERFSPAVADVLFRSTLGNPSMNAWFFRASVFAKIGCFDPSYRVAGDREFMLRFALSGLRHVQTPRLIYRYRVHPGSMTFGRDPAVADAIRREHERMTGRYLNESGLPARARGLIRRVRTGDTIRFALRSARQFDLRGLLTAAKDGTRHDPLWPARFAWRAARLLAVKMASRAGSRRP